MNWKDTWAGITAESETEKPTGQCRGGRVCLLLHWWLLR